MRVLVLGASYGSLLATKLAMAGHDATLVCWASVAELINERGTRVSLTLRGESEPCTLDSRELPGRIDATAPAGADPERCALAVLAMQEPQYADPEVASLLARMAVSRVPCLSLMNMPPPPYLRRLDALGSADIDAAFHRPCVWEGFDPGLVSLCSPDAQAFQPSPDRPNHLEVGLASSFRAAPFAEDDANAMLRRLEADIAAVRLRGRHVPVKLRAEDSLFVPLAKWSMLLAGNYRCVTPEGVRPIREAVHENASESAAIYAEVQTLVRALGAGPAQEVSFERYAKAARALSRPSSVARAIQAGATRVERVDRLVATLATAVGARSEPIERIAALVDARLAANDRTVTLR